MTPVSEVVKTAIVLLQKPSDVVQVRQLVRALALEIGLSLVDQTKIITAASELARNTVIYGGGGEGILEIVRAEERNGLRLAFEDHGPGIPDLDQALRDGFTSGGGLGLGLGGAKRLAGEFDLQSQVGVGTKVTIVKWK